MKITKYDFTPPWLDKKTPLLLIHGIGATGDMWFPQIPVFAKQFPVFTVDLPCSGGRKCPDGEITVELLVDLLFKELTEMQITKISVLGISLGALMALDLTARYPDIIDKLIIASLPYNFPEDKKPLLFNMVKEYEKQDMKTIAYSRGPNAFSPDAPEYLKDYLSETISKSNLKDYVRLAKTPLLYDFEKTYKEIKNETLIICSEHDYIATPEQGEKIKNAIKNSQLKIMYNTGHASSLENPEEFNKAVLSFILE